MQADAEYRMTPEDLSHWYVRNNEGEMVSFDTFATSRWVYGPQRLERYNGISAMEIQGQPAPGYSSGVAMQTMAELVAQLPPGIDFEWTGTSSRKCLAHRRRCSMRCRFGGVLAAL